jgi:cell wall-associated NlpC family hydrolase
MSAGGAMTARPGVNRKCRQPLMAALLLLVLVAAPALAAALPAPGVPGLEARHLEADYWVRRQRQAQRPVLDARAIAAHNARLQALDPSVRNLEQLPAVLGRAQVRAWVEALSRRPVDPLYDASGVRLPAPALDALVAALALEAIPQTRPTRYGLVTRRADLRTFPTQKRVHGEPGDTDRDLFQESALFPGTPVALVHESRDGAWWFVLSPLYAAWVEKRHVAEGSAAEVFGYVRKQPALVVTGARVHTAFTPEAPAVSALALEMGVRVPLRSDWPPGQPVHGQHPATAYVVELPVRAADGALGFAPALVPRSADVSVGPLPLTRGHLLRQAFKFLGERYGWGHAFEARDCSGFVSEVYRSFGLVLPRNTRDQAVSPALSGVTFTPADGRERRLAVLRTLQVGDLVYLPGHVMMVVGHERGEPYVIHDTWGVRFPGPGGKPTWVPLNAVSVTPLLPLLHEDGTPQLERITRIQRLRP